MLKVHTLHYYVKGTFKYYVTQVHKSNSKTPPPPIVTVTAKNKPPPSPLCYVTLKIYNLLLYMITLFQKNVKKSPVKLTLAKKQKTFPGLPEKLKKLNILSFL